MTYNCRVCDTPLVIGDNVTLAKIKHHEYRCRTCDRKHQMMHRESYCRNRREYTYRAGIHQPMNKNAECASFLGVYVAERVLSHVFKNVQKMPYGHAGYDFVCGGGYEFDVKSACRSCNGKTVAWKFHIFKNQIAKYFLCIAFDNREDLNPEHVWIIPGDVVNHLTGLTISVSTIQKWDEYAFDILKVSACCDIIRGK